MRGGLCNGDSVKTFMIYIDAPTDARDKIFQRQGKVEGRLSTNVV